MVSVILEGGVSAVQADTDSNRNLFTAEQLPIVPTNGGWYTVAGQLSSAVGQNLVPGTTFLSLRFSPTSTRKAYIQEIRLMLAVTGVAISGSVPGFFVFQRFNSATPTGGTARTVNKLDESNSDTSDMTDIRDNNTALTITNVVFEAIVAGFSQASFIASQADWQEWLFRPQYPIVLKPGNGLAFRSSTQQTNAGQTWLFAYTITWMEK